MKILFVAYCFASPGEEALIGVYKRGLRIALELARRGHDVAFFCTGREHHQDPMTRAAESAIEFVELTEDEECADAPGRVRGALVAEIRALGCDLVVIGEVPFDGSMLEVTLAAVEADVPVALLDNAYSPALVEEFCYEVGSMFDGVVLAGPSSFHSPTPPPRLCQVPPYVELPSDLGALAAELGLADEPMVAVLAYDDGVEQLGVSLLGRLPLPGPRAVFISRDPARCRRRLEALPAARRARIRVLPMGDDATLFGVLRLARLALAKYGYMQVSECLALGTPVISLFYEGFTWLDSFPPASRRFTHRVDVPRADDDLVEAAERLLALEPAALATVHDGAYDAAARAADFIASVSERRPAENRREAARLGFTDERVAGALAALHGEGVAAGDLFLLRAMRLRKLTECSVYSVLAGYRSGGRHRFARLWGRRYHDADAAAADRGAAAASGSRRRVLAFSLRPPQLIEVDLGQELLPPHDWDVRQVAGEVPGP